MKRRSVRPEFYEERLPFKEFALLWTMEQELHYCASRNLFDVKSFQPLFINEQTQNDMNFLGI